MTHIVASYTTKQNETELDLERKLTAGTNITVTDGGAGGNITVATTPDLTGIDTVQFDTARAVSGSEPDGSLYWNPDRETLDLSQPNGVNLQLGQEVHFYAINQTGSTIPDGAAVMYDGALGVSGIIKCKLAVADGTYPAQYMMGIATQSIANGATGKVTFFGELRGFNTSGYTAGDLLYIDPATPGGLTKTVPAAPNLKYAIAIAENSTNNGTIFVRAIFGLGLHELDDVTLASKADGDFLQYDSGTGVWKNETFASSGLDARYVNVTGDTMTGTLLLTPSASNMQLKLHPTLALTDSGVTYNAGFYYNSSSEPVFNMIRSTAGTTMLGGGVNGDTARRFTVDVGGTLSWGDGANAVDVVFQRTAANLMRLYDGLIVDNQLSIGMTGTTAKLNITQAANTEAGGIIITNSGAGRTFRIWIDGSNVCRMDSGSGGGGDIAINTTGAGKVGLGTITPAARLDVVGKADVIQLQVTANATQTSDLARIGDGTNYTAFEKDGTLKMVGTATTWDDLRVEPSVRGTGSNNPSFVNWINGLFLYDFNNATAGSEKEIFFQVQMPHNWKEGSTVEPHVHWVNKTAGTAGHVVRWGLEYSKASIGGTFGASTTVYATTIAGGGDITVPNEHMLTDFTGIDMTGNTISTIIVCRLFRNSSNAADTYTGTAGLLYVDWHYEIDGLGSRTELTK